MGETTAVTVREDRGAYVLDLEYDLVPTADLTLNGTAFGGFCVRARNDGDSYYSSPQGKIGLPDPHYSVPELNWPAAPWYDYTIALKSGKTAGVAELKAGDFDAIVVAGGQSPMFTFKEAAGLQSLFMGFFNAGKVSAALCHGTSLLLYLKNQDGTPFVKGRKITGFANSEEDYADKAVGQKLMPFRIEDEARKLGSDFTTKAAFQPYAVRDGNLVTGQQQHSGTAAARLVIEALGR